MSSQPEQLGPRYVSQQTAADYAGVSVATIRGWVASGLLTGYRMGPRLIRIDLSEIEAMLRPIPSAR
jgi:excisionase family DNA binding protein